MNLYRDGVFVHEVDDQTCVAAAVQGMLNVIRLDEDGRKPDVSARSQRGALRPDRGADDLRGLPQRRHRARRLGGPADRGGLPVRGPGVPVANDRDARRRHGAIQATGRPVGILAWTGHPLVGDDGLHGHGGPGRPRRASGVTAPPTSWTPGIPGSPPAGRARRPRTRRATRRTSTANFLPFDLPLGTVSGPRRAVRPRGAAGALTAATGDDGESGHRAAGIEKPAGGPPAPGVSRVVGDTGLEPVTSRM